MTFTTINSQALETVTGGQAATTAAPAPAISDVEMARSNDLTTAANARFQKLSAGFCGEFFKKASDLAVNDPNVAKLQAQNGIDCLGGLPKQ